LLYIQSYITTSVESVVVFGFGKRIKMSTPTPRTRKREWNHI